MVRINFSLTLFFCHLVSGLSAEIIQESPANTERYLDSDIDDDGGIITYEKAKMEKKQVDDPDFMGVFHDKFTREQCDNRPSKYRWRCIKSKNDKNMCRCAPKKCRGTPSYGEVYAYKLKNRQEIVWRCPRLPAYCGFGEPKCIFKSNNKKKWRCPACSHKTCPDGKTRECTSLKNFKNYHKCICYKTPEPSSSPTKHPTKHPTKNPTKHPTKRPSHEPTPAPTICRDKGHNLDYGDVSLCTGWVVQSPQERCPMTVNLKFVREYCPYTCQDCRGGTPY